MGRREQILPVFAEKATAVARGFHAERFVDMAQPTANNPSVDIIVDGVGRTLPMRLESGQSVAASRTGIIIGWREEPGYPPAAGYSLQVSSDGVQRISASDETGNDHGA